MTDGTDRRRAFLAEYWTRTTGDLSDRRDRLDVPAYVDAPGTAARIVLDPSEHHQEWLGGGAAITDSTASLLRTAMTAEQRSAILHELFDPEQAGFSTVRVSIGSSDFSSQEYYTYDDVPEWQGDATLRHFSIGEGEPGSPEATKDLKFVVPVLQEILAINPAVKVMASPWTAPAWMKTSHRLTHSGRLRFGEFVGNGYRTEDTVDAIYAQYFVRFIEAYASYGIPIYGVTIQNEPSNGNPFPIMIWTPEELADFGANHLRPALDASFPDTKLYYADDSFRFFDRPVSDFMTPEQAAAFDGIALHTYSGRFANIVNAVRPYPRWAVAMTERRCMLDETVAEASHVMFGEIGTWLVRHGEGLINLWNLALDEQGLPSYAGTAGRRGVITIDTRTGGVIRNLEYFMLRNFGQDVPVGSRRIGSTSYTNDGRTGGIGSVAFTTPDGDLSAILYNPTDEDLEAAVTVNGDGARWQLVSVPAYGTISMHKSRGPVNVSEAPKDDIFAITYLDSTKVAW